MLELSKHRAVQCGVKNTTGFSKHSMSEGTVRSTYITSDELSTPLAGLQITHLCATIPNSSTEQRAVPRPTAKQYIYGIQLPSRD